MTRFGTYRSAIPRGVTGNPELVGAQPYTREQLAHGEPCGLVVGGDPADAVYCLPHDQHSITVGISSAGKTRSVIVPSILLCGSSRVMPHLFVSDCKRTTFDQTSGLLRKRGYTIRHIDLRSEDSPEKFNVLAPAWRALRKGDAPRCESLLGELTRSLTASVHSDADRYWENSASAVIASTFYHLCTQQLYKGVAPTIADIVGIAHLPNDRLRSMVAMADEGVRPALEVAYSTALHDVNRTWTCIQSVVGTMTAFYTSPLGMSVAGESTFDPAKDFLGDEPCALFVTCPDEAGVTDAYVAHLFHSSTYLRYVHEFESRGLEEAKARPVLAFMDEVARFPKCGLSSIVATGRSRRFFVNLCLQSFSQFCERGLYTEEEATSLIENCRTTVYMASTSRRIGDDAAAKSRGLVGIADLATLPVGEAYVTRPSMPVARVRFAPIDRYREVGLYPLQPPAATSHHGKKARKGSRKRGRKGAGRLDEADLLRLFDAIPD